MADDAAAMEQQQEEDAEEEGPEDDEDDDEERKRDVTRRPPSQLLQQDAASAEPSNAPSLLAPGAAAICKELQQVEVELRLLEALEIYHPSKLLGMHRHFILYGLMENLERRLNHHFTAEEILELLDRFYNLELLKPDEEEIELLSREEDFSLPAAILAVKEEPRGSS